MASLSATSGETAYATETVEASLARRLTVACIVGALALALYLPGLGSSDFVGDDEALDAGVVWQMVRGGDWLFPEFNAEYLPPKPPLFYWEAAIASKIRGQVDEWSLRLPSAIAGAVLVAMTVACGARLIGMAEATLAGFLLAVMPVVYGQARIGRCDMTMTVLVVACLFLFRLSPEPMPRPRRWLFFVLLGLAALAKASAAIGLIVVVVLAETTWTRRWSRLRSLVDPSLMAFLVIGGGWYALATWHWGSRFVDEQILGENLRHFFGGLRGSHSTGTSRSDSLNHLVNIFAVTIPWGFFLPWVLFGSPRSPGNSRPSGFRFLVLWLFAGLLFFSLAARKSPYYLLPLAPAVALLVATWKSMPDVAALIRDLRRGVTWRQILWPIVVTIAIMLPLLGVPSRWSREVGVLRALLIAHPFILPTVAAGVAVLATQAGLAAHRRNWGAVVLAGWATMAMGMIVSDFIDGPLTNGSSLRPFAGSILMTTRPADRLYFFKLPLPAVALYTERRILTLRDPTTEPDPPYYLIVPESLSREVPRAWLEAATTVASGEGRVFTRKQMGIRLLRIDAKTETSELTSPPESRAASTSSTVDSSSHTRDNASQ